MSEGVQCSKCRHIMAIEDQEYHEQVCIGEGNPKCECDHTKRDHMTYTISRLPYGIAIPRLYTHCRFCGCERFTEKLE